MNRLVIFSDYYYPGSNAGGPIRSIHNMKRALASEYVITHICGNTDLGSSRKYSSEDRLKDVIYIDNRISYINIVLFLRIIKRSDAVVLNSFFSPMFTVLPLLLSLMVRNKVKIFPRGELSLSALQYKRTRKLLWCNFFKITRLYRMSTFYATSMDERENILNKFPGSEVKVVKVNVDKPLPLLPKEFSYELVCLSRVVPIKNIEMAIQAMVFFPDCMLKIYGPLENLEYYNYLVGLVSSLGLTKRIKFYGELNHGEIHSILNKHDILLHPSLSENFGHSVYEALSSGLPVLVSENTMWTEYRCGAVRIFELSDGVQSLVKELESLLEDCKDVYSKLSLEAHRVARDYYEMSCQEYLN